MKLALGTIQFGINYGIELVMSALQDAGDGEIFIPKVPSYRITDVTQAISPGCDFNITVVRLGEKLHEEMITASDSGNIIDIGGGYAIPSISGDLSMVEYCALTDVIPVANRFPYNSVENEDFLTPERFTAEIIVHLSDPETEFL